MLIQYMLTVVESIKAKRVESSGLEWQLQYNIDVALLGKLYLDSTFTTYICHFAQPLTLTISQVMETARLVRTVERQTSNLNRTCSRGYHVGV
jgi:hypothetical protein